MLLTYGHYTMKGYKTTTKIFDLQKDYSMAEEYHEQEEGAFKKKAVVER